MNQESTQSSHLECANCGTANPTKIFDANDFDTGKESFSLYRCTSCKLVHISPMPDENQLGTYYKNEYYGKGKQKFSNLIEKWTISRNLKLAQSIAKLLKDRKTEQTRPLRVLDIGCGRGNLLKAFSHMGFECHGIERAEFPDEPDESSINIHRNSLEKEKFDDDYFDIVILWHVLEHLSNPTDIVGEIHRILNRSGILVIAVPNFGSFQSRLFKKHWFHLDLPRHLYHFEMESLDRLLNTNNIYRASVSTRSIDQSVFGFIQSALNTLNWFTPNSFYEQLKLPLLKRKPDFYLQSMLAIIITPFALLDYFFSAATSSGSCLIITARKEPPDKTNSSLQ